VARRNQTNDSIVQKVHPVGREMKKDLLAHLIKSNDWDQVLVFTRMKSGANKLVEFLEKQGISAMAIHGNKSQAARTKALAEFKTGDLTVLVATDIAARGIDIDQLPHVVNFELPNVPEDYVHRIGRTGRAGSTGEAVSLVCVDENGFLRDIERLIKHEIPKEIVEGFAPPAGEKPEPIVLGRMVIGEGAGRGFRPSGGGGHCGLLGLSGGGGHPCDIGGCGGGHRRRGRALPGSADQSAEDRLQPGGGGPEVRGEGLPGRGRGGQGRPPGPGIHPTGVNLRRQQGIVR
jgi:ATP-dependent RNA helicase RhlE